ncbi:unnamed protein product [Alopecurus aequalis]
MADDEQNQQPPRYWFPYWSGVPQPPPPSRPSRQQSRRLSPPSPVAAPSSPRRPSPSPQHRQQPTTAPRGAAPPPPSPLSQVSRPSPSRTSPLAPIRAPAPPSSNSNAVVAAAPAPPAKPPAIPAVLLLPAAPEAAPRQKDVDVVLPPVKPVAQVQTPAAAETKPHGGHGKAADKEHKSKDKEKEKDHKEKKDETKSKDKEKEKDHKEKEKKHHAGEGKEVKAEHGKLHREIKAGVADMVHKANGAAAPGSGHERGATTVITLAGENKGASMKVGGGKGKNGGEWHGHGHRLDGGSCTDGKKAAGKEGMMTALINSNVQVINNSLLLQSSCHGADPGVHLKLSAKSASKDKQKHGGGGDKATAAGKK